MSRLSCRTSLVWSLWDDPSAVLTAYEGLALSFSLFVHTPAHHPLPHPYPSLFFFLFVSQTLHPGSLVKRHHWRVNVKELVWRQCIVQTPDLELFTTSGAFFFFFTRHRDRHSDHQDGEAGGNSCVSYANVSGMLTEDAPADTQTHTDQALTVYEELSWSGEWPVAGSGSWEQCEQCEQPCVTNPSRAIFLSRGCPWQPRCTIYSHTHTHKTAWQTKHKPAFWVHRRVSTEIAADTLRAIFGVKPTPLLDLFKETNVSTFKRKQKKLPRSLIVWLFYVLNLPKSAYWRHQLLS